jgi:hypothetical protein
MSRENLRGVPDRLCANKFLSFLQCSGVRTSHRKSLPNHQEVSLQKQSCSRSQEKQALREEPQGRVQALKK